MKRITVTGPDTVTLSEDGQKLEIRIPIRLHRRGSQTCITDPSGQPLTPPKEHPAPALRDALVRAHIWLRRLETGKATSLQDIAKQEGMSAKGRVSSLFRLVNLSPTIQEAILTGEGLRQLTLDDFMAPFSDKWIEQEKQFLPHMGDPS